MGNIPLGPGSDPRHGGGHWIDPGDGPPIWHSGKKHADEMRVAPAQDQKQLSSTGPTLLVGCDAKENGSAVLKRFLFLDQRSANEIE